MEGFFFFGSEMGISAIQPHTAHGGMWLAVSGPKADFSA